nr:MAG TPA: hypothetical protein [Caudoviricetes sp.]
MSLVYVILVKVLYLRCFQCFLVYVATVYTLSYQSINKSINVIN